jgi:ABC-type transport system involved in multi-copper enzyme maturation permease subunit
MSAAALTAVPAAGRDDRPGLGRLTLVELRKMTDTRAGFWLQLAIVALTIFGVVAIAIWADPEDQTFEMVLSAAIQPASILGPVVGVLLVSSEWSQRTAQITFGLVPRRGRVIAAKLLAGLAWCVLAFALSVAASAVGAAVSGVDGAWDVTAALVFQDIAYIVISVLGGIAFGAALLASAPAIVLYFVLPIAWAFAGNLSFLEGAARWLDSSRTTDTMTFDVLSGDEWARVATTVALWVLVPLLIGVWRILKGEVR